MNKFKVGDRVKCIADEPRGMIGTVRNVTESSYAVEFEDWHDGHGCVSRGLDIKNRAGWLCLEEWLEPVTENKYEPPFYVDCPTEEIYEKVAQKMMKEYGGYWMCSGFFLNASIFIDKDGGMHCWETSDCTGISYTGKSISYQEFLGEEKKTKGWTFKYHSPAFSIRHPYSYRITEIRTPGETVTSPFYKFTHSLMETLKSIPDRLKRTLNASLQACYKLGWIDGDLDVTEEGKDALMDFLFDKHEEEMGKLAQSKIKELKKKKSKKGEEDEE